MARPPGSLAESSVVLSLRELGKMEEERMESAAREAALARARREQLDLQAREAAAEQLARERVEREERDRRDRREAANAEALKLAAAERARTEILVRAEEERRESDARRATQARSSRRRALGEGVLAGVTLAFGIACGVYEQAIAPAERAAATHARDAATSCNETMRDLRGRLASTEEGLRVAGGDLEAAGRERDRLRSELDTVTRDLGRKNVPRPPAAPGTPSRRAPEYFSKCPPGSRDPMCVQ
ncbi:MAG TPA: hypothetical protein VKU41_27135 [Polyangiaceae bacterium]|nr:hypothetical protein [Polyangiaceae bacterium]